MSMDLVQKTLLTLLAGLLATLVVFYVQTRGLSIGVRGGSKSKIPTFLIIGSNNAGKTALYYRLRAQVDQDEQEGDKKAGLPATVSSLEANDDTINLPFANAAIAKPFRMIDFPGHLKYTTLLQKLILEDITLSNLKGIVFVVDSSANSLNQEGKLDNMTKLLFDVLSHTEKLPTGVDFLFAVNKQDLFDSLPVHKVKDMLAASLNKVIHNELSRIGTGGYDDDEEGDATTPAGDEALNDAMSRDTVRQLWSIIVPDKSQFRFEILEGNMEFKGGSVLKGKTEDWENWFDERVVNYGGM